MVISSRFQSTANCPDAGLKATNDRGPGPCRAVAASAGAVIPAATAAMATRTRALPVLRMLAVPLAWGRSAASAGSRPRPCRPGSSTITFSTWRVFTGRARPSPPDAPGRLAPPRGQGLRAAQRQLRDRAELLQQAQHVRFFPGFGDLSPRDAVAGVLRH